MQGVPADLARPAWLRLYALNGQHERRNEMEECCSAVVKNGELGEGDEPAAAIKWADHGLKLRRQAVQCPHLPLGAGLAGARAMGDLLPPIDLGFWAR